MKKLLTLIGFGVLTIAYSQTTFWTEDFGTGCDRGQIPSSYTGTNGTWGVASTGANDPAPNAWYVSGTTGFTSVGACSDNCLMGGSNNRSLHIGNPPVVIPLASINIGPDTGSTYLTGVYCGFGICSTTNSRAESPTIDCSGYDSVTISFNYFENGEGTTDDGTLWYSSNNGSTWSQVDPIAKGGTSCAGVLGGTWQTLSVMLPNGAWNNSMVKIGFNWTNDGNSMGTDPSFAVDNITLSGVLATGGPTITTVPINGAFCAGDSLVVPYTITGTFTGGNVFTAQLSDGAGSFASPTVIGTLASTSAGSINCGLPAGATTASGYEIRVVSSTPAVTGSTSGAFTINALPAAVATNGGPYCTGDTIILNATGGISYTWTGPNSFSSSSQSPNINGCTTADDGTYTVTVTDGNGCSSATTTIVTVTDCGASVETIALEKVTIYPNPATDVININVDQSMVNNSHIQIMDMVGKVIYRTSPSQINTSINTTALNMKAGIYLVQVNYGNQHKTFRLVKR